MNLRMARAFGVICLLSTTGTAFADETLVSVSGDITVNGKPITSGRIFFFLDDDQFVGSKIKDGKYKVTRVPVGACRVAFEGEGVPVKAGAEKSYFAVDVKGGGSVLDFDMKKK